MRTVITLLFAWATLGNLWPARAQERIVFNLPSQSLGDSVRAIGSQLSINVLFDPTYIEDQPAPALKTVGTVDHAFTLLLKGSGFTHRHLNDNTIVLVAIESDITRLSTKRLVRAPITWLRVTESRRRTRQGAYREMQSNNFLRAVASDPPQLFGSEK